MMTLSQPCQFSHTTVYSPDSEKDILAIFDHFTLACFRLSFVTGGRSYS